MDKQIKSSIKNLLLLDTIISSTSNISRIMEEAEQELDEIFGKPDKKIKKMDELLKFKTSK